MRPFLFLCLTLLGWYLILPHYVAQYVRQEIHYLFTFEWLREIYPLLQFWIWIPQQCTVTNVTLQLTTMHGAIGVIAFVAHHGYIDAWLKVSTFFTFIQSLFYLSDVITIYAFCDTKYQSSGKCPNIITDGINSTALFNWWLDAFSVQWICCIFIIIEGWRVRMKGSKVFLYALLSSSFFQICAFPAFLLDRRSHLRMADVMWILDEKKDSPILLKAKKDAARMVSQQRKGVGCSSGGVNGSNGNGTNGNVGHGEWEMPLHGRRASLSIHMRSANRWTKAGDSNHSHHPQHHRDDSSLPHQKSTTTSSCNSNLLSPEGMSTPHGIGSPPGKNSPAFGSMNQRSRRSTSGSGSGLSINPMMRSRQNSICVATLHTTTNNNNVTTISSNGGSNGHTNGNGNGNGNGNSNGASSGESSSTPIQSKSPQRGMRSLSGLATLSPPKLHSSSGSTSTTPPNHPHMIPLPLSSFSTSTNSLTASNDPDSNAFSSPSSAATSPSLTHRRLHSSARTPGKSNSLRTRLLDVFPPDRHMNIDTTYTQEEREVPKEMITGNGEKHQLMYENSDTTTGEFNNGGGGGSNGGLVGIRLVQADASPTGMHGTDSRVNIESINLLQAPASPFLVPASPIHHHSDKIDMDSITSQFWKYGINGIPVQLMKKNPSLVPFRCWPIMFAQHTRFGLDLSLFLPIYLIMQGAYELWTWLTWMSVHTQSHCWLGNYFDHTFDSPSSLMMTSIGWHSLFTWGMFMCSCENRESRKRKYLMYPLLLLTFHNVTTVMVVYILWREFRLKYLPSECSYDAVSNGKFIGNDESVWTSSSSPSEYFTRPQVTKKEKKKQAEETMRWLSEKIMPICKKWMIGPVLAAGKWIGSFLLTSSLWTYFSSPATTSKSTSTNTSSPSPTSSSSSSPSSTSSTSSSSLTTPVTTFLHDTRKSLIDSMYLNLYDMIYLYHWLYRIYRKWTSSAPLPTPSSRQTLIDWTTLIPYLITTWILWLNLFILSWYFSMNSATRGLATGLIALLNGVWMHLTPKDKIRAQWYWLNYELTKELVAKVRLTHMLGPELGTTIASNTNGGFFQFMPPSPRTPRTPRVPSSWVTNGSPPHSQQHHGDPNGSPVPPPTPGRSPTLSPPSAFTFSPQTPRRALRTLSGGGSGSNANGNGNLPVPSSPIPSSPYSPMTPSTPSRVVKSDDAWVRPFEWNPHILWSTSFLFLSLLACAILIPDPQFNLFWWSKGYMDFRQSCLDTLHRVPGQAINTPLFIFSLMLGYPLFFGFSLSNPRRKYGLPFMSLGMKCLCILPLLITFGHVWHEQIQPCYLPLGIEGVGMSGSGAAGNTPIDAVISPSSPTDPSNQHMHQLLNDTITSMLRARASTVSNVYIKEDTTILRPIHPKTHGCVEGVFSTPYFIPAKFRAGIFDDSSFKMQRVRKDSEGGNDSASSSSSSSTSNSWRAFIRFSNGAFQTQSRDGTWTVQDDSIPDVRGMSVKLVKVHGEKVLDPQYYTTHPQEQLTQDFLTITSEYFFQNTGEAYAQTVKFLSSVTIASFVEWFFPHSFTFQEVYKMYERLKTLYTLYCMNSDGKGVVNPLDVNYYSTVPFRLGDEPDVAARKGTNSMAVKYRWKPCVHVRPAGEVDSATDIIFNRLEALWLKYLKPWIFGKYAANPWMNPEKMTLQEQDELIAQENPANFLRINLQRRLDPIYATSKYKTTLRDEHRIDDEVCFDLMIQDQINACKNKIEEPMTTWRGTWIRVGRLRIPKQRFLSESQLRFCENLSFNPWHSLRAHKPLGEINQLRRTKYVVASEERRKWNQRRSENNPSSSSSSSTNNQTTPHLLHNPLEYTGTELTQLGEVDHHLSGDVAMYGYSEYGLPYNTMPKRITTIPYKERMTNDTHMDILSRYLFNQRSIAYPQPKLRLEYSSPQDYEYFMLGREDEKVYNNTNKLVSGRMRRPSHVNSKVWTNDQWWAAQFIRGLNPMMLMRCTDITQLPWNILGGYPFPQETLDQIAETLREEAQPTSLELLAKEGRLFYIDYVELEDIATYGDRILYSPVIVFYLPSKPRKRDLLPLFIQLERNEFGGSVPEQHHHPSPSPTPSPSPSSSSSLSPRPRLFFPVPIAGHYPTNTTNAELVWLFAKMHLSSADAVYHQMIYHLLETHLSLEPAIIATYRAFRTEHHINRLLSQHFIGTIAINDYGRSTLLSDMNPQLDGFLATGLQGSLQIMQKHYRGPHYRFLETVPNQLRRRGFSVENPRNHSNWGSDEKDELPGFLYRDYGLAIYDAFHRYVHNVLNLRYGNDSEPLTQKRNMDEDHELHAWLHELSNPLAANIPNAPKVHNFTDLVDFVAQMMFQSSVQHAAVNFGQFEYQAFQPSRPLYLTRDMPQNLSLIDHSYMLRSLMPMHDVLLTLNVFDVLSACCVNTLMLDMTESDGFLFPETTTQPSFPEEWKKLMAELKEIEMQMKVNNAKWGYHYPYLYPSRIPQSIAI